MTYYGRWTYKYEEAARHGAAGVLVVHETAPASYGWKTVKNSNTNTMFDIVRQNPAAVHTPLETWIQRAARGADLRRVRPRFRAGESRGQAPRTSSRSPLKATLGANYRRRSRRITSHNVVGILPGKNIRTRR